MTGTLGSLAAAAVFFIVSHFVLASPSVRPALAQRLGENGFRGVFSLVAIAGLAWLLLAFADAPTVALWPATAAAHLVPLIVMPFAAILLVAGASTRSPTAIGWEAPPAGDPAPGILKVTRHPILWAIGLWALAHIVANGTAAGLIFFGALAVLAFAGMAAIDHKKSWSLGAAWGPIALTTSVIPLL